MFIPKKYKELINNDQELYDRFIDNRKQLSTLVTSNYDITKECNMTCEGCLFFDGEDYMQHHDSGSLEEWEAFFKKEQARGVSYPYFAGSEPALVVDRLKIASKYFSKGLVFTNGSIKIDTSVPFKLHISVWGLPSTEEVTRNNSFFMKALKNYQHDERALFVFTINAMNIDEIEPIILLCQEWNAKLSFSLFSPTTEYLEHSDIEKNPSSLMLSKQQLLEVRNVLDTYIDRYPDTLLYTKAYNHWVTNPNGLYEIDEESGIATDCAIMKQKYNIHYRTDFTSTDSKCCMPNIDCTHCRPYAAAFGSAIARYKRFFKTYDGFKTWNNIAEQWIDMFFIKNENYTK